MKCPFCEEEFTQQDILDKENEEKLLKDFETTESRKNLKKKENIAKGVSVGGFAIFILCIVFGSLFPSNFVDFVSIGGFVVFIIFFGAAIYFDGKKKDNLFEKFKSGKEGV